MLCFCKLTPLLFVLAPISVLGLCSLQLALAGCLTAKTCSSVYGGACGATPGVSMAE